jgi:hypothetical protein
MSVAALAALQSWPPPCEDNHGLPLAGEALFSGFNKRQLRLPFVFGSRAAALK